MTSNVQEVRGNIQEGYPSGDKRGFPSTSCYRSEEGGDEKAPQKDA